MHNTSRNVILAALVTGVTGDRLLYDAEFRMGFALWAVGVVICTSIIGRPGTHERRLVLGGVALAAFGIAWRDSQMLNVIDSFSLLTMGALAVWIGSGRRIADLTIPESVRAGLLAAVNTVGGAPKVVGGVLSDRGGGGKNTAGALVVGSVLAVPPLIVVAALLASSDKVFDRMLTSFADGIMTNGIQHLALVALLTWLASGWMRATLGNAIGSDVPVPASPRLPFLSISVGLYALIALLGTFIAVQARVLFGGAAFLRDTEGLTVATYARDGFFQLILAAGVVLITLVMAEWFMTDSDETARRRYRTAAAVLLAMVATLLVSSAVRIGLYVSEFGLSVDRVLAVAAIVWVFAALAAFSATTLRGQPGKFMPVTLLTTVGWVAAVNLMNPEAIVVRANLARAERGESFDAAYHAKLSADALPALRAGASRLPVPACLQLEAELRNRLQYRFGTSGDADGDWRSRNVPLWRAQEWLKTGQGVCGTASLGGTARGG